MLKKDISKESILALKDAIELLSGKWKFCILHNLHHYGTMRFKDLQEAAVGITYAPTKHAMEVLPVINALLAFGEKHRKKIKGK